MTATLRPGAPAATPTATTATPAMPVAAPTAPTAGRAPAAPAALRPPDATAARPRSAAPRAIPPRRTALRHPAADSAPRLDPTARLLLTAATADVTTAAAAFEAWFALPRTGAPDPVLSDSRMRAERRLLPVVAARLHRHLDDAAPHAMSGGVSAPARALLLEARADTVRRNLPTVARLRVVLDTLRTAGIEPVVTKGAALLSDAGFGDTAARPMADVDLLVAPAQAERAVLALEDRGQQRFHAGVPFATLQSVMHAASLFGPLGEIDLHWTLLRHGRCRAEDERVRASAVPAALGPLSLSVPDPSRLLFHVLAHGRAPDLHWLADAAQLLSRAGVDPQLIADVAVARRYARFVTGNAAALHDLVRTDASATLHDTMRRARPRAGDALHRDFGDGTRRERAAALTHYARVQLRGRTLRDALGFPGHLMRYATGAHSTGESLRRLARYAAFDERRPGMHPTPPH